MAALSAVMGNVLVGFKIAGITTKMEHAVVSALAESKNSVCHL